MTRQIGTEQNPLVHPVTGERIVFRKRSRDIGDACRARYERDSGPLPEGGETQSPAAPPQS